MIKEVDEKDVLLKTFAEVTSLIISGRDNSVIFQKILNTALDILPANKVHLIFIENHRVIKYTAMVHNQGRKISIEDTPESEGILNWLKRESELIEKDNLLSFDLSLLASECLREEETGGMVISAPLSSRSSVFGILVAINDPGRRQFKEDDLHLLTLMANQAAIAIENYLLYKKLEVESITDGLTGVYNFRFLIRSLKLEMKRASRFKQVFSFLMLDVDNLKDYNDKNGHLAGSRALKAIASVITQNCRAVDLVAKYGGDEFAILLPHTNIEGAKVMGRRILQSIKKYKFDGITPGLLTCSIGVAAYPEDCEMVEELIEKADKALYTAKNRGKNNVVAYREIRAFNPT